MSNKFSCGGGRVDQLGASALPGPLPHGALYRKDNAHVMVSNLPSIADDEIRSNQSPCTLKLPLTTLHLPHHSPLLQVWLSARPNISLPNGAEAQSVFTFPKGNHARFLKATLSCGSRLR